MRSGALSQAFHDPGSSGFGSSFKRIIPLTDRWMIPLFDAKCAFEFGPQNQNHGNWKNIKSGVLRGKAIKNCEFEQSTRNSWR